MLVIALRGLSLFMVVWMLILGLYDTPMVMYFGIAGILCWLAIIMFFFYMAIGYEWST